LQYNTFINQNGTVGDYTQVSLRLETTNRCNCHCTFCVRPTMQRSVGDMDSELCRRLIREGAMLGMQTLDLRSIGEPLLDTRLPEFVNLASSQGFSNIYIHTNGLCLDETIVNTLGEAGISNIDISLSPKTSYRRTRPGVDADELFSRLESLARKQPRHFDKLLIDYIDTGDREAEAASFLRWLESIGYRLREKIRLHNWGEGIRSPDSGVFCHRLWTSLTILVDGRVALCCLDYEGQYGLGNVRNSSLDKIFNSSRFVQIRQDHLAGQRLNQCARCDLPAKKDYQKKGEPEKKSLK